MSLTKVSYSMIQSAPFNVVDYGAVGDGVTDDTAAFNAAMLAAANAGGGVVLAMPAKTHYIATTILMPTNVTFDLQNATLKGTGNSSGANILLRSAVLTSGSLVANTSANVLTSAKVCNGGFYNAKQAMYMQSCIDGCAFENLTINACYNGIYANFCLYATFSNIMYRNAGGYGYQFDNNCNAITLKNLYAVGNAPSLLATGFVFSNKAYTVNMLNCSTEYCSTGILATEVHQLAIDGHYFEEVGLGINMQNADRKVGVTVQNCYFSAVSVLMEGLTVDNIFWSQTNTRDSNCVPGTLSLPTNTGYTGPVAIATCTGVVELNTTSVLPTSVGVPAWMVLSDGIELRLIVNASIGGTGPLGSGDTTYAKALVASGANEGVVPFYYSGGTSAVAGTVPFNVVAIPTGASVTATVTSRIYASGQSMGIFWLYLEDDAGAKTFQGRCYATSVFMDSALPVGYNLTVTSTGFLRINITGVNNTSGTARITGQFRHI